jgi:hypothetical protein
VAWEDVAYWVEKLDDPHFTEFLTAFAQVYVNGGVVLRSFRATNGTAFDHALRHDNRTMDQVFGAFLTRPSVASALPELQIHLPLERPPEFRWMSAFGVEGDLTHMLLVGGAYERFRGTVEQARTLSRRFMEALFGEELHRVGWAGGSPTPWTPWFFDIAWDATFVLQDQQMKRFVLLCMTDTD